MAKDKDTKRIGKGLTPEMREEIREFDKELHEKCYLRDYDKDQTIRLFREQIYKVLEDYKLAPEVSAGIIEKLTSTIETAVMLKTTELAEKVADVKRDFKTWLTIQGVIFTALVGLVLHRIFG